MPFELKFLKTGTTSSGGKEKKRPLLLTILASLIFVLVMSYLLYIPQTKVIRSHSLNVGDIVYDDIVIKKTITLEDKASTQENKQRALENIVPIYEFVEEAYPQTRDQLKHWFQLIRTAGPIFINNTKQEQEVLLSTLKNQFQKELGLSLAEKEIRTILTTQFWYKVDINRLLTFIKTQADNKILTSVSNASKNHDGRIKLVYKTGDTETLALENLTDLKNVRVALTQFVKDQKFPSPAPEWVASVLMEFIEVNVYYSVNLTEEVERKAMAGVNPVLITLKEGKVILRKGDEVTLENMRILKLIATQAKTEGNKLPAFILIAFIMFFLASFGDKFFKIWTSLGINQSKLLIVMGATLVVCAAVYRVTLFIAPVILRNISADISIHFEQYSVFLAIPFAVGVLTIAFIFNLQSAVIFSFINAMIGGIICEWDFKIFIYILLGNLAASYGIEYYQRLKRSPIIKAAIFGMLPIQMVVIIIIHITRANFDWLLLAVNLSVGILSAVVSPILANFLVPLWESIFKLVTELKLVELTNLNLPIFREMLEKAPGTYHHSLMVASLSEAAAQELELSPLLERAMALYHDIGKINGPHFFTENHSIYVNPHPNLAPRDSAKNIISHIPEGLERAEKLKLPPMVFSAIEQHHGTKLVRFFYDKARETSAVANDGFDDNIFKYPGKKPENIENAIIMLADQVEAASKSLASPTDEEIKNVIRKIIDNNIVENQFDECEGLTFKALNIIANSFHKKLSSIYHMRVSYPGFNFKEKELADENGRNSNRIGGNTDRIKTVS